MATIHAYTSHSGRTGYSVANGNRVYLVTPVAGPGRCSPVTAWEVWKSDSLTTIARFPATATGLQKALERAGELADKTS